MIQELNLNEKIKDFNRTKLDVMQKLNEKVSFYSEIHTDYKEHPHFYAQKGFNYKLKKLYNNTYKLDAFLNIYMGENIPSVEVCNEIYNGLFDVFSASNQVIRIETLNDQKEVRKSFNEYFEWFKTVGFSKTKTQFNSFIVVDLKNGLPNICVVAPEYVKYYDIDDKGNLEQLVFSFDNEEYYWYTSKFYSVWIKKDNLFILKPVEIETPNPEEIEKEIPEKNYYEHGLNRFPGNVFFKNPLNSKCNLISKNVIVPELDSIHTLVVKSTELYMSEFQTSNPIKVQPDQSCGYENSNEICKGGRLFYTDVDIENGGRLVPYDDGTQKQCPQCGHNKHIGAGAGIAIDLEKIAESGINVDSIIKYFSPPLEGTEYQKKTLFELRNSIISGTIGIIKRDLKQARNETDIQSDIEARVKALLQFGYIYGNTIADTQLIILKLLFGVDKIQSVSVFLGSNFFLQTKEEMLSEKSKATNPIDRTEIQYRMISSENKNNPEKERYLINCFEIMPYSGITDLDFLEYVKLGKVSEFDTELRLNFDFYTKEFERMFSNSIGMLDVRFIKEKIKKMVEDKIKTDPKPIIPTKTII